MTDNLSLPLSQLADLPKSRLLFGYEDFCIESLAKENTSKKTAATTKTIIHTIYKIVMKKI